MKCELTRTATEVHEARKKTSQLRVSFLSDAATSCRMCPFSLKKVDTFTVIWCGREKVASFSAKLKDWSLVATQTYPFSSTKLQDLISLTLSTCHHSLHLCSRRAGQFSRQEKIHFVFLFFTKPLPDVVVDDQLLSSVPSSLGVMCVALGAAAGL